MAGPAIMPAEALRFLRRKRLRRSRHWLDVWGTEHAQAFAVAQMTELDMVLQTHRELQRALRAGETLETFRGRLEPWLVEKGWRPRGRGGSVPRRLERIYLTNLRAAAAAGHWDRIQRRRKVLPYLVYRLGPSREHRPDHAAWAGTCLPVGHPWWNTHYPPNGWGCKCLVVQVAEPPRGARTEAPPLDPREWRNPATGQIVEVPRGIDPGWAYNASDHAVPGLAQALTSRLQRLARPRVGVRGAGRAAVERLIRGAIETYLGGPAFARFVQRRANAAPRGDLGAPVALLAPAAQERIGARTPVVVLADAAAAGAAVERWRGVQAALDSAAPRDRGGGRWAFGAWTIEVVDGLPRVSSGP